MNSIKQYTYSSDEPISSDDEDNDDNNEKEKYSKTNFFNLEESGNEKCVRTEIESKPDIKTYTDSLGNTLEVPDTSFWSTVTPDFITKHASNVSSSSSSSSLPSSSSDLHWTKYNRKVYRENKYTRTSIQKRPKNSSKSDDEPLKRKHFTTDHDKKQSIFESSTRSTDINKLSIERKLYFVHTNIQTHISGHKVSKKPAKHLEKELKGHDGPVNRVKWNTAQYSHLLLTVSMDANVKIWNFWTDLDYCVKTIKCHNKAVRDADWSICGKKLVSCSYDKTATITDVEMGKTIAIFNHTSFVNCGKFHPTDANLILTGCHNGMLLWDSRSPLQPCKEYTYKDQLGQIQDLIFTHHGDEIVCCCDQISRDSADRNVMAWDFKAGVVLSNQIYQERYSCTRLKVHPTEGHFLAQSQGGYVGIFSINRPYKMNRSKRFEGHKVLGYGIGFDVLTDGSCVISGSSDSVLYCYNYSTGQCFRQLDTGLDVCLDVAVHPVLPSTLACCGWNGNLQLWH